MTEKILFVDDDANILSAYQRQLRKQFTLETAEGGEKALAMLAESGPFAVVMADMTMPGMNGIELLKVVKERSPNTVRMMLTGNGDMKTAVDAVNSGNIFRFLTKPCSNEILAGALQAGIDQYRLITAEKELLKNTLTGSVKLLTELLAQVSPAAFSRALRVRVNASDIAQELKLPDLWQYEVAAMLSQIGCITLPAELMKKIANQEDISIEEEKLFKKHPSTGAKLLGKIPRLEGIARMVEYQMLPFSNFGKGDLPKPEDPISLGAQALKVAVDFDQRIQLGVSYINILKVLQSQPADYNPKIIAALEQILTNRQNEKPAEEPQAVGA